MILQKNAFNHCREQECLDRVDCYFGAFLIPTICLVLGSVIFAFGLNLFADPPPQGNIFIKFIHATCHSALRKIKSKEKKDHFLDYCDKEKFSQNQLNDFKFVYPLMGRFLKKLDCRIEYMKKMTYLPWHSIIYSIVISDYLNRSEGNISPVELWGTLIFLQKILSILEKIEIFPSEV